MNDNIQERSLESLTENKRESSRERIMELAKDREIEKKIERINHFSREESTEITRERSREKEEINKEEQKETEKKEEELSNINNDIETNVDKESSNKINLDPDSETIKKFNELNNKYLNELNKLKYRIKDEIKDNSRITATDTAKKLGKELFNLLFNFEPAKENISLKNLSINKSLSDGDFINIVKVARNHISRKMNTKYLEELKEKFNIYKNEIQGLFMKKKIVKDLIESAIINILTTDEDIKEQENNFSMLVINDVTLPLINLPFRYNNKVINLNRDNLMEVALSYIPVLAYKNNLTKFVKGFKLKARELRTKIRAYVHSHAIYFTTLKDDMNGATDIKGDIYINTKFLKEYFEENNQDNKLIIREKIVLAYLQELNHALLKYLDEKKYSNFLTFYKVEKEGIPKGNNQLKFKTLNENESYTLPLKKSINNFNHMLFGGYDFERITIEIAKFLLNLRIYRGKRIHFEKLNSIFKTIKQKYNMKVTRQNPKKDNDAIKDDEDEDDDEIVEPKNTGSDEEEI